MKSSALKYLWHFVLTGVAIFIFVMAIKALYRLTKSIHIEDVLAAVAQIPTPHLLVAILVVAFGYGLLTLYDFIALRHLERGKHVSYPSVALTAFTAYAISHTVGANLVTATGIRYRHYNHLGISNNEIANIVWLVSMAFTFGITTLIGISLTLHPEMTVHLLAQLNKSWGIFDNIFYVRLIGLTLLAAIAGVIIYAGKQGRHVTIRGWRFDLPPAIVVIQQIVIAVLDLSTVALVLYLLLPPSEHISYWATFSAFIQSMAVGIVSHVPGGLGVFEVTMIAALPQIDRTQILAVLLIFRIIYYILPFLVALVLLLGYEVYLYFDKKTAKPHVLPDNQPDC